MPEQLDFFSGLQVRFAQNARAVDLQAPTRPEPRPASCVELEPIQAAPRQSLRSRIEAARCTAPWSGPAIGELGTLAILDARGIVEMALNAPRIHDERGPEGQPSGIVHLFVRPLLDLLGSTKATHACVVFDDRANGADGRRAIWNEYRPHKERPLGYEAQIEACRAVAQALGVWSIVSQEVEGRDVCATLVSRAPIDWEVHLTSDDRTLQQCQKRAGCVVRKVRRLATFEPSDKSQVDRLALIGDSGSGIPGVDKIGDMTAQLLLRHFGSIEALADEIDASHVPGADPGMLERRLVRIDTLRAPGRVAEALLAGQDALVISLRLVEIRRNVADSEVPSAAGLPELLRRGEVDSRVLEMLGKAWGVWVLVGPPREIISDST